MEERAPGNSTRGHRWDLSQPYLSSFKSLLGDGYSLARAPHIPLLLQAALPEVVLQGWALQFLCCCSSFVLHVSECCCWVGWGLDNPTCSSSSLGSKLSLTINHCNRRKLDRQRTNCGDTLSHSMPAEASPSTEGFMSRQSALLESKQAVKAAQRAFSCRICHDETVSQLTKS